MAVNYLQIGFSTDTVLNDAFPVVVEMEKLIPETHEFLFQFLDYDLSKVENDFSEYLSCVDSGQKPNKKLLSLTVSHLAEMHPYFRLCRENATDLLNRIIAGYIISRRSELNVAEQKKLFLSLCIMNQGLFMNPDDIFERKIDVGEQRALDYLYRLQSHLSRWVFLTLDNTNPALAKLSSKRRSALYSHIAAYGENRPVLSVEVSFSTRPTERMRKKDVYWDFAQKDHYGQLYRDLDVLHWDPEAKLPKSIQEIVDVTKNADDCDIITYDIRDFSNLLELEIHRMVIDGLRVKRCKGCRRYFLPLKDSQEYCYQPSIRSSSERCPASSGDSTDENKEAKRLLRRASQTHSERVRRGTMSKPDYVSWKAEADEKLKLVCVGELSLQDYREWLRI